jgi:aspartate/methionine/tyrosine aminotransferase
MSKQGHLINSPANPTGTVLTPNHLQDTVRPYVISDEIHGLVYEGQEHSILEYTDRAFVINGFSKAYAMTGWRLGYLIAPQEFMRPLQKLMQNFFISANAFVQRAGIAALTQAGAEVAQMRRTYNERRVVLINGLKKLGFHIPVEPTGAFYVFVNARHLSPDSYKLAFDILEKAHVGVTPGVDFGSGGEGFLRFSYANSMENIDLALQRWRNIWLVKIAGDYFLTGLVSYIFHPPRCRRVFQCSGRGLSFWCRSRLLDPIQFLGVPHQQRQNRDEN